MALVPKKFVAVVVAGLALLAGCGTASGPEPGEASSSAGFPVTIAHKLGSTTIPAEPKRIVALSFEEDLLGQIGLPVVAHADNFYESGRPYPWQVGTVDLSGSTAVKAGGRAPGPGA